MRAVREGREPGIPNLVSPAAVARGGEAAARRLTSWSPSGDHLVGRPQTLVERLFEQREAG